MVKSYGPKPELKTRRYRRPWSAEEADGGESFIVKDADGFPICYLYYTDDLKRNWAAGNRHTKDGARRIAVNIARLPELLDIEKLAKGEG